ncbi:hypothetical protein [Sphingobium sp. WCS2017Hpa-17]|uniref:hypothetical protein n=1 Tax=Sphingobium sp. WCS2017Hpa-17 TaxID=3073638 RepID=UPI00288AF30F|nr:hypothetical protein [Sphingobium sp. WCS2017Hpa-17]
MSGYYLMARGWQDNPIFGREEYSRRDAWVWMIEQAAHTERKVGIAGKTFTLQRGQFSSSLRYMAKAWGWDEAKVRRFLSRAKNENMIDAATDAGQTVITICNYDVYQAPSRNGDAGTDAATTRRRRGNDANKKEGNELSNGDNPPTPLAGGECGEIISHWNEMADRTKLAKVETFATDRRRKLEARLKEHGKGRVIAAIDAVGASPLCHGDNDRGWYATFDFILQPKSFAKLLEGAYGPRPCEGKPSAKPSIAGGSLFDQLREGKITEAEFHAQRAKLAQTEKPPPRRDKPQTGSIAQFIPRIAGAA